MGSQDSPLPIQSAPMRRWLTQILNELRIQFNSPKEPTVLELQQCGTDTVPNLLQVTTAILAHMPSNATPATQDRDIRPLKSPRGSASAPSSPVSGAVELPLVLSLEDAGMMLKFMREESHRMMKSFHHTEVPVCWRRLYTDTSILSILAGLQNSARLSDDFYKKLVATLDEAIVIAGAPGIGRSDMCQDAIGRIQEEYLPLRNPSQRSPASPDPSIPYPDSFADVSPPPELHLSKRPKRATRGVFASTIAPSGGPSSLSSTANRMVPRFLDPPSVTEFRSKHFETPFVIPRYAADWPACQNWTNPQYLRTIGGMGRRVPIETSAGPRQDYTSQSWSTKLMDWEEFLDGLYARSAFGAKARARAVEIAAATSISRPSTPVDPNLPRKRGRPPGSKTTQITAPVIIEEWPGETNYLAQHDLINQFPELRSDIIIPDYVYSAVPAPSWFPQYKAPRVDDALILNNWMGPKGTISPAHKDPYYNCYVQVVGRKLVWLAPADFDEEMYPYPSSSISPTKLNPAAPLPTGSFPPSTREPSSSSSPPPSTASDLSSSSSRLPSLAGTEPIVSSLSSSGTGSADTMLSNSSRVPIFDPAPDSKNKFPLFYAHVVPHAMSVLLEPGDMLVFPPGWWHAMRSEETSASVSMWF